MCGEIFKIAKVKRKRTITREVYDRIHHSFKKVINGRPFIACCNEDTLEITLEPCQVSE